jgi:GNAT superfamily N-acetyltransferase
VPVHRAHARDGRPPAGHAPYRARARPARAFREADGELYVYIEDVRRDRLVGYTVFNRLVELSREADRHIRAPHSQYDPAYQRRGLASAVYRWALDQGI